MKKGFVIILLLAVCSICSCKNKEDQSAIEAIVSDFYNSDYAYEETTELYASDGSLGLRSVYEGTVFQSPYKEHKKVISYDTFDNSMDTNGLLFNEIYFHGVSKAVIAYVSTDNGWVKQMVTRTYPYGYGESITFSEVPDKTLSTDSEEVYTGEYKVVPSLKIASNLQISAVVKQKYYVDKKSGTITRIETDLTDLDRMANIINCINMNGDTLEEAQKKVSDDRSKKINRLTITEYGNPDDFQIPDVAD